jgi:peroxin-3
VELLLADLKQRQLEKNSLLEESKKQKREMWNSLKIKTFARLLVLIYLINLLSLFTTIQISLLGRNAYLDSLRNAKLLDDELDDEQSDRKAVSEDNERHFLTLSWYLLNIGWKTLVSRVEDAVKRVLDDMPLSQSITHGTMIEILDKIRKKIDYESDNIPFKYIFT